MSKKELKRLHVQVPVKLYMKLWEYVKKASPLSPQGMFSQAVREAIAEYLKNRGVNVDE